MTPAASFPSRKETRRIEALAQRLVGLSPFSIEGEIGAAQGLALEVEGLERLLAVGDRCEALLRDGRRLLCETVGFRNGRTLVMPFGSSDGVTLGTRVRLVPGSNVIFPDMSWRGRVLNALAQPLDAGPLLQGEEARATRGQPPPAYCRKTVGTKLATAVRALDIFVPLNRGQRLGVFAGSGVGKSSLLSMIARASDADINVIALVGERGREVQEFIRRDLGEEGLARSVLVVSTSDEPPLLRRQAAWTAMTIAEYFRDQGLQVAFMMDSVTRFAMAQREIGLATGEPPTTKGYPPTAFAELPRLLERAGPGMKGQGDITGIFSVLVDGDDHNEPIADAVRGILDGHVVLDRKIADRGRFPAINILQSISRMLPDCHSEEELKLYRVAKEMLAAYEEMADMIRIGAYERGSDPRVDAAIAVYRPLEDFLTQAKGESEAPAAAFQRLEEILQQVPGLLG